MKDFAKHKNQRKRAFRSLNSEVSLFGPSMAKATTVKEVKLQFAKIENCLVATEKTLADHGIELAAKETLPAQLRQAGRYLRGEIDVPPELGGDFTHALAAFRIGGTSMQLTTQANSLNAAAELSDREWTQANRAHHGANHALRLRRAALVVDFAKAKKAAAINEVEAIYSALKAKTQERVSEFVAKQQAAFDEIASQSKQHHEAGTRREKTHKLDQLKESFYGRGLHDLSSTLEAFRTTGHLKMLTQVTDHADDAVERALSNLAIVKNEDAADVHGHRTSTLARLAPSLPNKD